MTFSGSHHVEKINFYLGVIREGVPQFHGAKYNPTNTRSWVLLKHKNAFYEGHSLKVDDKGKNNNNQRAAWGVIPYKQIHVKTKEL